MDVTQQIFLITISSPCCEHLLTIAMACISMCTSSAVLLTEHHMAAMLSVQFHARQKLLTAQLLGAYLLLRMHANIDPKKEKMVTGLGQPTKLVTCATSGMNCSSNLDIA